MHVDNDRVWLISMPSCEGNPLCVTTCSGKSKGETARRGKSGITRNNIKCMACLIGEGPGDRIDLCYSCDFYEDGEMIAGVKRSVSSHVTCHFVTSRVYDGAIAKVLVLSACPSFSIIQDKV